MNSQEESSDLTSVQGNGDFNSENHMESSTSPRPELQNRLPQPINDDDHADDHEDNIEVHNLSGSRVPCLENTTEEVKDFIYYLQNKVNMLYRHMRKTNRDLIEVLEEQVVDNNRLNNLQQILDQKQEIIYQQEEKILYYGLFFKSCPNDAYMTLTPTSPIYETQNQDVPAASLSSENVPLQKESVETKRRRPPVQSVQKNISQKRVLPPIVKTNGYRPIISKPARSSIQPPLRHGADASVLIGDRSLSKKKQTVSKSRVPLPPICARSSRKPDKQDSVNIGSTKKTHCNTKEERIVLPIIKTTSVSTSQQHLRHRIKSSVLPDMPKPVTLTSYSETVASRLTTTLSTQNSNAFNKSHYKRPKVLLPALPSLYQSNRRKERIKPSKLPPICNLGLDDTPSARMN